jgi:hypothetical protein
MSPKRREELVSRLDVGSDADKTKVYDFSGGPLEGGPPIDPPPPDASPKRFLRYAIQEIQPLLVECHHGLPSHGTLAMRFILVGAPGIGTIVESVDIDNSEDEGSADVFEPSFTECMRETLYAIELPPMATPDRWDVRYPFVVTSSAADR